MSEPADLPALTEFPLPTAQLLHELPDGTRHVDWLIAQDRQGERPLITFRLPSHLEALAAGAEMPAERIADHRPVYLHYEGPIEGGRGCVVRLARGEIVALWRDDSAQSPTWDLEIRWTPPGDGASASVRIQHLRLERADFENWRVICRRIVTADR